MKKTLLYLIFIGLFFSNAGQAHSLGSGHLAITASIHKRFTSSIERKRNRFSYKLDVITYIDDNDDCDDIETSVKEKAFTLNTVYLPNNPFSIRFSSIPFCTKINNLVNDSRLPRYTYISLRVLRL